MGWLHQHTVLALGIAWVGMEILFEVGCLHQHTVLALGIAWVGMDSCSIFCVVFLHILIAVVYFKDQKWISKTVYCISCLVVCKIAVCSEFPDIPNNAGRKTTRRKRTQAISKRYEFHANAIILSFHFYTENIKINHALRMIKMRIICDTERVNSINTFRIANIYKNIKSLI